MPIDAQISEKRNVAVLVAAQAILGSQMPIAFVLGGLSGQVLSPDQCLATLPITFTVLGSMITAPVLANVMQRHGRRLGFVIGAIGGGLGGALCALGLFTGSFVIFLIGSLATGIYMSAQGFYRFAAADLSSDGFRARAISWTMAGGLVAAIVGPQLVKLSGDWTDPVPFAGAYLIIVALNACGAFLFALLDTPGAAVRAQQQGEGRSRGELLRTPAIFVPMVCAMVTYSLMNLVMTSTPLAVVGCGFSTDHAADIVSAHVLGMFVPSFFTGHLIDRFGSAKIIATGLVALGAAGIIALTGVDLMNFYITLILLGIGWNFGYIGSTTMLSRAYAPHERGRVQGMNDFAVFGMVTLASFSSGMLMNCSGGSPVEGWAAVNIAMVPFLILAGAVLIWFALRPATRRDA